MREHCREQKKEIPILQIQTFETHMELVKKKFHQGISPAIDMFQQDQVLESYRALRIQAESEIGILKTSLALLLGRTPDRISFPPMCQSTTQLPQLPPLPNTGLPAELIQKRPDIRAAYLRLQSSDKYLAAAIASQYPQVNFTLEIDSTGSSIKNIFSNWLTKSLTAGLWLPLFEGSKWKAEAEIQQNVVAEQLHLYSQTLLNALKEVEDALFMEQQQQRHITSIDKQLSLLQNATTEAEKSYRIGAIDFDRFLDILMSEQSLAIDQLQAQGDLIDYRIHLYRALGSSFEIEPLSK